MNLLAATTAHLDIGVLTFILGVGLPILTGLITKSAASPRTKAVTLLTLVVAATVVQRALDANGVVNLKTWLTTALVTWIVAIATHFGLLKPTGVSQGVANIAPQAGIGYTGTGKAA